jgi:transposase
MAAKTSVVDRGRSRRAQSFLDRIRPNSAGIDCGSRHHYVAVPPDRDPEPVRRFSTFTADLHRLADWLVSCRIDTVAMESTGVYWMTIYDILEEKGIEVLLVNARQLKNVDARKSDVIDCAWIRDLNGVGMLKGSFRPTAQIRELRTYMRHREVLVQTTVTATNRMEKALVQMNLQLHLVISDLTGQTGQRIIRDIVAGRRDPRELAKHRDPRCHASVSEIEAALTGYYRPEHLFVLQQNLDLFDATHRQIDQCDREIESCLARLAPPADSPTAPAEQASPRRRRRKPRGNEPQFDIQSWLERITPHDASHIDGIGPYTTLRLIAEVGTDMTKWGNHDRFTSWLTLTPNNRISGGRLLSSRTVSSANRAAALFRLAAMTLARSQTALGAFYRRLACRKGKAKAITATARKLAILFYRCLSGTLVYKDPGVETYHRQHRESLLRSLRHKAEILGFNLVDVKTGEVLAGVS